MRSLVLVAALSLPLTGCALLGDDASPDEVGVLLTGAVGDAVAAANAARDADPDGNPWKTGSAAGVLSLAVLAAARWRQQLMAMKPPVPPA